MSTMQSCSSSTISPPDPMMAPDSFNASKSIGRSNREAGRHPPDGPPIWTALIAALPETPPPISSTTRLIDVPIGTSMSPPRLILPARANVFVPGLPAVPTPPERVRAVDQNPGHRRQGFDIVDEGRGLEQAGGRGVGGARARDSAFSFDGGDQCRFFATDKSPRPFDDLDGESPVRAEGCGAQPAGLFAAHDGLPDVFHGERIFASHEDKSAPGSDGHPGDQHAFDHPEWHGLQQHPVHERSRVSLVGIADHEGAGLVMALGGPLAGRV
jgi:hypothetical protein